MAENDKEDFSTRVMNGLATMSTAFLARKALIAGWTKVTGKEPPTNPEDPQVALPEAIGWSVLVGITVAIVRVFTIRAMARRSLGSANREPANAADA